MPVISTRSLHFKHIVEAAGIRDNQKSQHTWKHKQERARHIHFTGAAQERSLAPLAEVVSWKLWHHQRDSTTNAAHNRKLCVQPAFEGLDAHCISVPHGLLPLAQGTLLVGLHSLTTASEWNGNMWTDRCTRKLATDGKRGCQMLLPAQSTCTTAIWGASNWITLPLLLAKSPGVEEKCQTFEGYYINMSLIIAEPLTTPCFCLIEISSTVLYTQCAFSQPTVHSRFSTKKSAHWNSQAFFRKLMLLLLGATTHGTKHWHQCARRRRRRGSSIPHARRTKWPSEKDFYSHD